MVMYLSVWFENIKLMNGLVKSLTLELMNSIIIWDKYKPMNALLTIGSVTLMFNKAQCPDKISPRLLKELHPEIDFIGHWTPVLFLRTGNMP